MFMHWRVQGVPGGTHPGTLLRALTENTILRGVGDGTFNGQGEFCVTVHFAPQRPGSDTSELRSNLVQSYQIHLRNQLGLPDLTITDVTRR